MHGTPPGVPSLLSAAHFCHPLQAPQAAGPFLYSQKSQGNLLWCVAIISQPPQSSSGVLESLGGVGVSGMCLEFLPQPLACPLGPTPSHLLGGGP